MKSVPSTYNDLIKKKKIPSQICTAAWVLVNSRSSQVDKQEYQRGVLFDGIVCAGHEMC